MAFKRPTPTWTDNNGYPRGHVTFEDVTDLRDKAMKEVAFKQNDGKIVLEASLVMHLCNRIISG